MNGSFDRDQVREWFAALGDGTLSDADHARLVDLMSRHEAVRQLWYEHSDLEVGLADWAAVRHEGNPWFPVPAPAKSRPPGHWIRYAGAAAALIALLLWAANRSGAPVPPAEPPANGVAVLTRAVGAAWAEGMVCEPGTVLPPGTLKLVSGMALVEFFSGVRVVLEGPVEFRLISAGEAFLQSGKVNAHVPPQARGFVVHAPGSKVVDHGTDFGLIVSDSAPSEVHVFTGRVEVFRPDGAPREVNGGEAVRLETSLMEPIPSARPLFVSEEELVRRDAAASAARFAAWQATSAALSKDPATVLHYLFEPRDAARRELVNLRPGDPSAAGIVGCRWSEGRWPGKPSLEFRSGGDRVRLSAPTPLHAVTLLAWVRVDALPRPHNVLLSADSEAPGALRWHLMAGGQLRLEIARDLGRPQSDWEAVNSAPFVTPDRYGQWVLLATTFDGKSIRHYGNGRLIGSGASFTPPVMRLGTAEFGNWTGATQRQLAGAVDEFAVLSRAMGDAEVLAFYQNGKP